MATATTTATANPATKKLLLRTYDGFVYRDISAAEPRDCTPDEVPIIDLKGIYGNLEARRAVARELLRAAETTGFFYIKNHGAPEGIVQFAHQQALKFFSLPLEAKEKVAEKSSISSYGYHGMKSLQVNPSSGLDREEGFNFHYDPKFDPLHQHHLSDVSEAVKQYVPRDEHIWQDVGLPEFQTGILAYYQALLALSRRLIRIIALALDLPEDYFDRLTEYPGGDCALNFYPGHGDHPVENLEEPGLGAHTDLQIFTILYQSQHRGLQVLNKNNEWVNATPIPGTFVVNIGDFFTRMTNDRLKSTVHRVLQHGKHDRLSMPFFFGFNWNEKCSVIETCTSPDNPAKYQPETCGELVARRLAVGDPKHPNNKPLEEK